MRQELLWELDKIVDDFLDFFQAGENFDYPVYPDWTAKDILGHVVFWHESFACNLADVVEGNPPNPMKGSLAEVNQRGFEEMQKYSIDQLIEKLQAAQTTIRENILKDGIELIPYKKGSRSYGPDEHLEIVRDHIRKHWRDLQRVTTTIDM